MEERIKNLCYSLTKHPANQNDKERMEQELMDILEEKGNLMQVVFILKTESDQMVLFILIELLNKIYMKDSLVGVSRHSFISTIRADEAILNSSSFKGKKFLIDSALEILVERTTDLQEVIVEYYNHSDRLLLQYDRLGP